MEPTLKVSPVGWWYQDDRDGSWVGPFPTDVKAESMARDLISDHQKEIHLLQVAPWNRKTVTVLELKETG